MQRKAHEVLVLAGSPSAYGGFDQSVIWITHQTYHHEPDCQGRTQRLVPIASVPGHFPADGQGPVTSRCWEATGHRAISGGKSADKAVCAAVSQAFAGWQRGRSSRCQQLGGPRGWRQAVPGACPVVVSRAPLPRCRRLGRG